MFGTQRINFGPYDWSLCQNVMSWFRYCTNTWPLPGHNYKIRVLYMTFDRLTLYLSLSSLISLYILLQLIESNNTTMLNKITCHNTPKQVIQRTDANIIWCSTDSDLFCCVDNDFNIFRHSRQEGETASFNGRLFSFWPQAWCWI